MSMKGWRMSELVVEENTMVKLFSLFSLIFPPYSVLTTFAWGIVGSLSRRHHNHSHHQHTSSSHSYHSDHSNYSQSRSSTPLPPTPSRQTRSKSSSNTLGSISRRLGSALPGGGNTPGKGKSVSRKSSNVHQDKEGMRPLSPLPMNGDNVTLGRRTPVP